MRRGRAFTLIEVMVVLLIAGLLAAGLSMPLAAQMQLRRIDETHRRLDEAREALLGFAASNGRLPCPATEISRGEERFAPGGDAVNGQCERFHDGYLPAATLGLAPLDEEGFLRDAWGSRANRIRYAVPGIPVGGVTSPFTRANGLQASGLAAIGAASHFLFICAAGSPVAGGTCGPASNQLTRRAAFVLLSVGADTSAPSGGDSARNVDGSGIFVAREAGPAFDDLVTWVPVAILASRLMAAGRLP